MRKSLCVDLLWWEDSEMERKGWIEAERQKVKSWEESLNWLTKMWEEKGRGLGIVGIKGGLRQNFPSQSNVLLVFCSSYVLPVNPDLVFPPC